MRERGARPEPEQPQFDAGMARDVQRGLTDMLDAATGTTRPQAALPINWWKLDASERQEALETLLEWVPELVRRYALTAQLVPPCWWQHESMIQELLALFQYRNQMQFNLELGPPPSAPLDYHYQFKMWRDRMREWVAEAGCSTGRHEQPVIQPWADPSTTLAAQWSVDVEYEISKMSEAAQKLDETTPES